MTTEEAERIEALLGSADEPPPGTRAEELTIKEAESVAHGWRVGTEQATGFIINKDEVDFSTLRDLADPKPGDRVTLYARGSEIVGFDLNGQRLYLRTERETNLSWLSFRAKLRRQRLERFEVERESLDRKYAELPKPLQARIDRFRADPEFRVESEAYEMAAVYDAPKIARAIASQHGWELDDDLSADVPDHEAEEAVTAFRELRWEEQAKLVADLEPGHSGNTFGGATMLAYRLLAGASC